MSALVARWLIALILASLAMGLVLAHAAYAGDRPLGPAAHGELH